MRSFGLAMILYFSCVRVETLYRLIDSEAQPNQGTHRAMTAASLFDFCILTPTGVGI